MTDKLYCLMQFFKGVPELKMPKLPIKWIYEDLDKVEKSNPLRYMANGHKNKKTSFTKF